MKTYKVLKAWEGVKVGEELEQDEDGWIFHEHISPLEIAVALHLGFIEEVGAVKEKFVPKILEMMFLVDSGGEVEGHLYEGYRWQKDLIAIGNCYRTKEEAHEARERVLKAY